MVKKRKSRTKKTETENYVFKIDGWEAEYHFGVNKSRIKLFDGDFWESSDINLKCTILSPKLKNINRAVIRITGDPRLDNHWKKSMGENPPLGVGFMQILRDNDTLDFFCPVPSRAFYLIPIALAAGRIEFVSAYGEKIKWRKATIFNVTFSTVLEGE